MSKLFDSTTSVIEKSLDLHLARHTVIADNIANAETPGFKARRVDFEKSLQQEVDSFKSGQGQRDIASLEPTIYEDPYSEKGLDLNTVDMDREMAAMTKNDIQYSAATQAISKKFALLKYSIMGGDK
jgi:flagellar basal-body rod protein FlgB